MPKYRFAERLKNRNKCVGEGFQIFSASSHYGCYGQARRSVAAPWGIPGKRHLTCLIRVVRSNPVDCSCPEWAVRTPARMLAHKGQVTCTQL